MTNVFSKYTVTVPTRDQCAATVAQVEECFFFFVLGFLVAFIPTRVRALKVH